MKQNTTYKQTELGLIPEDWEVKEVKKIAKIYDGTHSTPNYVDYGIPFYSVEHITSNNFKNTKFISEEVFFNENKRVKLERGDILMSRIGDIGTAKYIDWDVNASFYVTLALFKKITEKIDFKFITFSINSSVFAKELHKRTLHVAFPKKINLGDIGKCKIPLPPLPEQKKIADCLSTWDSAIEKQSALINALTQRKKALMQQLLTGKKRLPGFSDEWKEVKLGDLFEKINRKNEEGNTNVVTISAQRGFVKQTDFFNKSVASETLDNYSLIYHGEFCYNKSYSNGYPLGATKRLIAFEKAVVTTLYICFKIKDQKKSNGSFFEQFFEANSLDRSLIKIAQEGGRAHGLLNVSLSDFFNIKIKLPPIEEQTAIAEILAAADRELQLQKEKLAQLQTQKKGLMQVLLTGKKRLIN